LKHLEDDEIQAYLDGRLGRKAAMVEEHLGGCEVCRGRLEEYRFLFSRLGDGSELPAIPNLEKAVMARVVDLESTSPGSGVLDFVLAASAVAVVAVAMWLALDFTPILGTLAGLSSEVHRMAAAAGSGDALVLEPWLPALLAAAIAILAAYILNGHALARLKARSSAARSRRA
jgi:hypothetical protein